MLYQSNPTARTKHLAALLLCCILTQGKAQPPAVPSRETDHQLALSYDVNLLQHPLVLYNGLSLDYVRPLQTNTRLYLSGVGGFRFISVPDVERKYIINAGVGVNAKFLKRGFISLHLRANYIVSALAYDLYAYNQDNVWRRQSNRLTQFSPSADVRLGSDLFRINQRHVVGLFLGMALTNFDKKYNNTIWEGYKPSASAGITLKLRQQP